MAAAQVRLALLETAAVGELDAHMARVFVRIGIPRIDLIAHLFRERRDARVARIRIGERVQANEAVQDRVRDAEWHAEFRGIGCRRMVLRLERLPQSMHDAFGGLASNRSHIVETPGYQAPPLDGVWATAPFFHNASVPSIYHVLNSKVRPKIFTRSYRTEKEDYDLVRLGWKITVLDQPADPNLPGVEKRRIYDTTVPGQGNAGHTFGDDLSEEDRMAVIEYLKTL